MPYTHYIPNKGEQLMTKQITLEEVLSLGSFKYDDRYGWQILDVKSDVTGDVCANVHGGIYGDVGGDIYGVIGGDVDGSIVGNVVGNVFGDVKGKINHRPWQFIETPKEKFQRLLQGTRNQELIDAFNQLENN